MYAIINFLKHGERVSVFLGIQGMNPNGIICHTFWLSYIFEYACYIY